MFLGIGIWRKIFEGDFFKRIRKANFDESGIGSLVKIFGRKGREIKKRYFFFWVPKKQMFQKHTGLNGPLQGLEVICHKWISSRWFFRSRVNII